MFRNGIFVKNRFLDQYGNYVGLDRTLKSRDVRDGMSVTIMISEKRVVLARLGDPQEGDQMGWTNGYGVTTLRTGFLPPLRDERDASLPVGDGFGASHSAGINALFCDGSVRTIRYDIAADPVVLPLWHPVMLKVGIEPLPNTRNLIPLSLFQRMCHRSDGTVINMARLDD